MFQLLPYFLPVKKTRNIVIVVCPLNSIIEDQLKIVKSRGITVNALVGKGQDIVMEQLFSTTPNNVEHDNEQANLRIPEGILNGQCSIIFAHPKAR